jgi:hypothetical protein
MVAPSYSIVLWFTQPPWRSINNSTGWLASIGMLYSRFAAPILPRAPGSDSAPKAVKPTGVGDQRVLAPATPSGLRSPRLAWGAARRLRRGVD